MFNTVIWGFKPQQGMIYSSQPFQLRNADWIWMSKMFKIQQIYSMHHIKEIKGFQHIFKRLKSNPSEWQTGDRQNKLSPFFPRAPLDCMAIAGWDALHCHLVSMVTCCYGNRPWNRHGSQAAEILLLERQREVRTERERERGEKGRKIRRRWRRGEKVKRSTSQTSARLVCHHGIGAQSNISTHHAFSIFF